MEPATVPQIDAEIVIPNAPEESPKWAFKLSVAAERAPRSNPKTNPPNEPTRTARKRHLSRIYHYRDCTGIVDRHESRRLASRETDNVVIRATER